mmetsp:Transcript_25401/g.41726  ORF Transcript_25401/g.41726 Transcript_25401/m.41726 type:complete len:267 (-) Transcript_25401:298-1098(-)
MLVASSRRAAAALAARGCSSSSRRFASSTTAAFHTSSRRSASVSAISMMGAIGLTTVAAVAVADDNYNTNNNFAACAAKVPTSGDVLSVGKITKEPATGISFPELCNGLSLAGVGVRIKYVFVKVYGVGAYFDPIAMMAVKKGSPADIEQALLDPTYPRCLRIVMNRGLSIDKFTSAIVESVEPRLKGKNLETLEEFKALFAPVDLMEGDEIEMTIRGDVLLLKTALGVGTIKSRPFTEAMCDVYFGADPVSPTLKEEVLKGIPNL